MSPLYLYGKRPPRVVRRRLSISFASALFCNSSAMRSTLPVIIVILALVHGCASPQDRAEAHVRRAVKMIASSQYRDAMDELKEAREQKGSRADVDALQGEMLLRMRDFEGAEA